MAPSTPPSAGTSSSRAPGMRRRRTDSTSRSVAAPRTSTSGPAESCPLAQSVVLVRHGETEWSLSGRHTGKTDIPLTEEGRRQGRALGRVLRAWQFAVVLTSPLQRAVETCRLAGYGDRAQIRPDLAEWDYGRYEGLTSTQIEAVQPDWSLWRDGGPDGEDGAEV